MDDMAHPGFGRCMVVQMKVYPPPGDVPSSRAPAATITVAFSKPLRIRVIIDECVTCSWQATDSGQDSRTKSVLVTMTFTFPVEQPDQKLVLAFSVIFSVVPTAAVILRLWARRVVRKCFDESDYCIVIADVSFMPYLAKIGPADSV
jgi:hypothetical protein